MPFLQSDDQNQHHHSSPSRRRRRQHQHRHNFCNGVVKTTLVFALIGLSCVVLMNKSSYSRSFSFSSSSNHTTQELHTYVTDEMHRLNSALKKAAMEDKKTVILTTLNAAWTEPNSIFDLFLESFRIGNQTQSLLNHLVVVAFDQTAYSRCLAVHPHCFALTTDGVDFSGDAFYMTEDYLKMMWRRIDFLRIVLELGYDFVFTDADVMWFRDPFQRFYSNADFQIACDVYEFGSTDLRNIPNGGFNYAKSNNRTINFYKYWYNGRENFPGKHDQDVLNVIKMDPYVRNIGLEMRFLDTAYFGGFCEPSKDLDLVCTVHANCCVGSEKKIHHIKIVIDDWKKYVSGEKDLISTSWSVPKRCG